MGGVITDGINNLPSSLKGRVEFGGSSLEGIPSTFNGTLLIDARENPTLTRGLHKHIRHVDGSISIFPSENGNPVLGVLNIKGDFKFSLVAHKHPRSREVEQMINAAKADGTDIFEVQEAMIDAGLSAFAKM